MYIKIDKVTNRHDEKALFSHLVASSLFFIVLLSYYNVSRCFIYTKTLSNCLIQATYYHATTHRYMNELVRAYFLTIGDTMKNKYNVQIVRVQMTEMRIYAKIIKYMMLATMTFCLVYIALWFQHYEAMVV